RDCTFTLTTGRSKLSAGPDACDRSRKYAYPETPFLTADRVRRIGGSVSTQSAVGAFHGSYRPRNTAGNHAGESGTGESTSLRCADLQRATRAVSASRPAEHWQSGAR